MKRLIAFTLLVAIAAACSKDKFESKPTLTFKSKNGNIVPPQGSLRVLLDFTDKEGDVSDTLYLIRQRLNRRGPVTRPAIPYQVPVIPNNTSGELQIDLDYDFGLTFGINRLSIPGTSNPIQYERDTLLLKFVLKDKAGNKSDTATTDVIVIR
jgi:hypothetical protein